MAGIGMWIFHNKMKKMSNIVSVWSKEEFGDIFQRVRMYEYQGHKAEENYMTNQSDSNKSILHQITAKYIMFLKLGDTILKRKPCFNGVKRVILNLNTFIL